MSNNLLFEGILLTKSPQTKLDFLKSDIFTSISQCQEFTLLDEKSKAKPG